MGKYFRVNTVWIRWFNFKSHLSISDLWKNKFTHCTWDPPQSLVGRLKENLEKMTEERNQRIAAENREKEQNKRMQRQIRDMKEEMGELSKKEGEASRKKHELVRLCVLGDLTWFTGLHTGGGYNSAAFHPPGNGHWELRGGKSELASRP